MGEPEGFMFRIVSVTTPPNEKGIALATELSFA